MKATYWNLNLKLYYFALAVSNIWWSYICALKVFGFQLKFLLNSASSYALKYGNSVIELTAIHCLWNFWENWGVVSCNERRGTLKCHETSMHLYAFKVSSILWRNVATCWQCETWIAAVRNVLFSFVTTMVEHTGVNSGMHSWWWARKEQQLGFMI